MKLSNIFGSKPKHKIFICYRRSGEGAGFGGRIADKLVKHFGQQLCFRDIENIEKGTDFVSSITDAISICELLLVIIGPDWTSLKDANGIIKIHDKNDFVRLELGGALARNIRVIPVLVGGAKIPSEDELPDDLKSLVRRQSHELTDKRWDYDSDQLIQGIEAMGIMGSSPKVREARKRKQRIIAAVLLTSIVALVAIGAILNFWSTTEGETINDEKATHTTIAETIGCPTTGPKKINCKREKARIRNAIILAADLEASSFITLDENPLKQVYTADMLRNYTARFDQYRTAGLYRFSILEEQSLEEFNIYWEGNKLLAEVEVNETWSSCTHKISDQLCLEHSESHEAPQTVFLEKKKESWYVTSISHQRTDVPETVRCRRYDCHL